MRVGARLDAMRYDIRDALRALRRSPGVAVAAILTLALAIGANTAVFSVVDAALFKPLPYEHADRLVHLVQVSRRGTAEETGAIGLEWHEIDRWRLERQIFDRIETHRHARVMPVEGAPNGQARVGQVSPGLLALLAVRPRIGRWFGEGDREVVLLSEPYWRQVFDEAPDAAGGSIVIDRRPHTIVGVMPATFSYGVAAALWVPLDETQARASGDVVSSILRLREGLTIERAELEVDRAAARISAERSPAPPLDIDLASYYTRRLGGNTADAALLALLGAVGAVLLIASANVANLLLARMLARRRETSVRAALGASRSRLVQQAAMEGAILTAVGCAAALALAWLASEVIPALVPERLRLFAVNPLAIDTRVLTFCAAIGCLAAVLATIVPALRAAATPPATALAGGRTAGLSKSTRRTRAWLQGVQVALTFVLLAGAGLMIVSLGRMLGVDPGYAARELAYVHVSLPADRYPAETQRNEIFDSVLARVRSLPQVQDAAYGTSPPEGLGGRLIPYGTEDGTSLHDFGGFQVMRLPPGRPLSIHDAGERYFRVAGIPLKRGRLFDAGDTRDSLPVAIIDENAAAAYWPGRPALGERFRYSPNVPWLTVVGVVGNVKPAGFAVAPDTVSIYLPMAQRRSSAGRTLLVRSADDPSSALAAAQAALRAIDPALASAGGGLVEDLYGPAFESPRFFLLLMSVLAGLALATAAIGLYGALRFTVGERQREIGIRLALGAPASRILTQMLLQALKPVVAGLAVGAGLALWLTRYLSSQLYGIAPEHAPTYAGSMVVLIGVALLAALLPARAATKVDPAITLTLES